MKTDTTRKTVTIFEEDESMTLFKPFSAEYPNSVFVVFEDAYGMIDGKLVSVDELKITAQPFIMPEELDEILNQL